MSFNIGEIASGSKAFPFEEVGDKVSGTIKLIERRQQTSFENSTPLTWDDGSPRMLTYIELDTDLRDDDDDDGVRALYCKGGNFEAAEGSGASAERALVEAAKKAGMKNIDEGAKLQVVFTGRAKPTTRGYQPAKLFTMKLEAPKASVAVDDLFDD
jgi:hypothetical protein